ncbi:hypothetical protein N7449_011738 [Penicillium cf. viridicatum]|uniref:Serine hydrolase domain-containing protein n=1 Tax=Penicillium cf. viridicatum TaxID=2972119 RepID=A0A9W9ITK1_9EURO|nr:hypothetical protein N7449_011738 [Penicillium cf. viridicatum]
MLLLQFKTEFLTPRVRNTVLNALQQDPSLGPGKWPAKLNQPLGESNYRWAWGHGENSDYRVRGLEQSVDYIFRYLDKHTPFLGIMGFSMGAAMSAIIASLLEKRHSIGDLKFDTNHPPLRFVVAGCGFTFANPLYNNLHSPKIKAPIFFVIASIDVIVAESASLNLRGHYVPRDELFLESLAGFIEDVLGIKEDHEEYYRIAETIEFGAFSKSSVSWNERVK